MLFSFQEVLQANRNEFDSPNDHLIQHVNFLFDHHGFRFRLFLADFFTGAFFTSAFYCALFTLNFTDIHFFITISILL